MAMAGRRRSASLPAPHQSAQRYQAIADYLRSRQVASLVSFEYEEKGVRSAGDGKWYPLVTMEWVEGETLYTYVRTQCLHGHGKAIAHLADHWIELVRELAASQIAHGDLQHGNVMVANTGRMKLVDYDCMCVPSLEGRKNLEVGVNPYQHPSRNENTLLDRNLDNFSALFILVALKALAATPIFGTSTSSRPVMRSCCCAAKTSTSRRNRRSCKRSCDRRTTR